MGVDVPHHDWLTGLATRDGLREHLVLAAARSRRNGTGVALLHLGIDGFKLVNASLGHAGGNALLQALAARVATVVRSVDVLARPVSDELMILLMDVPADELERIADTTAERALAALAAPFSVQDMDFQVGASVGIALLPDDAVSPDELLDRSAAALRRAKRVARGSAARYVGEAVDPRERLALSSRLRRALARDEFVLHYQPIYTVPGARLAGVEALIRWEDPELGLVPPGAFIPLAEETGLIEPLGDWVVGAVCRQQVLWAARGLRPYISFNVSPRQLHRLDFCDRVAHHLQRTGADPSRLIIELTESATFEDPMASETILRQLHDLGLRLALDDFGTGHSSLSRLRDMPVETVKIDRAFLRQVPENTEASAVVTAILRLSDALGRTAVAEGVETAAQHAFLAEQGCPMAQGFLLARPAPADVIEPLLYADQTPSSVSVVP